MNTGHLPYKKQIMPNTDTTSTAKPANISFIDKRLLVFIITIIAGLVLSANLLLSIGQTSKVQTQLRTANALLLSTQEFQIKFDLARAAITRFMFIGSDETWETAIQQMHKLPVTLKKLSEHEKMHVHLQQDLVEKIKMQVNDYINNLPPLKKIRQDFRGVVEGVVTSNTTQSSAHYEFSSTIATAIEILLQDDDKNIDLIVKLHSARNRWLQVVNEFRALLLLRNQGTKQSTLLYIEQFQKEWKVIQNDIDNISISAQSLIMAANESQRKWLQALPQVINVHMGKRWRRDLRYMAETLTPISDKILLSLNMYDVGLAKYIKTTTNETIELEKRNLIWVFVVMGLIIAFSLSMLLIYTRLLSAQQRKRMDAEHINQLKTGFLSTVSHELRTPLNAIMGFSQLLNMNIDKTLTDQQKSNISEINIASEHLLELVTEILDISAIESGNISLDMQKTNLCKILEESVLLSKALAKEKNIHINTPSTQEITCYVDADPVRLRQIFINLISNAIKYNKEDGEIIITIKNKANMSCVYITDTGHGITKKNIDKLFQPFERLGKNNDIEGTGLGLMVTKGLVEAMNGKIGVESKPDKGSTFWIELVTK